jgi:hypothetical protein
MSETKVVNVKVAYLRPKYANLQDWMNEKDNVYIGRARIVFLNGQRFPTSNSPFANPFRIGKHGTRLEIIEKYERYMRRVLLEDEQMRKNLLSLRGKNLGCWCAPEPCHGDVLVRLLDEFDNEKT